jgi:hypothetical protein
MGEVFFEMCGFSRGKFFDLGQKTGSELLSFIFELYGLETIDSFDTFALENSNN